jgi:hypothetical protein
MNTAPAAARAERALNKALNSEAYRGDLLLDIENKKITLDGIDKEHLPVDLRDLSAAERKREIERRIQERRAIRSEIVELSKTRDAFIADVRAKAGKQNGFDSAVAAALAEQLAKRGIK